MSGNLPEPPTDSAAPRPDNTVSFNANRLLAAEIVQVRALLSFMEALYPQCTDPTYAASLTKPPEEAKQVPMDDKDVRRLEDRIEAVNREGQLRLEAVMAKIDGKLETITAAVAASRDEVKETRAALLTQGAEIRSQGRDTRALIIGAALAVLFGIAATLIGLKQVWVGGVQVGQAGVQSQTAPTVPPVANTPTNPR